MTIIDTIADQHYGDRVKMAFAFADLLNAEARALEADGVDVIQFDEPAFNVYMKEVSTWGIEALHRAIDGLNCRTAVHICYGYGIKANIDWKATLGGEWRQYEEIFPALAASRIAEVSVECIHSKVPLELAVAAQGQGRPDRRHRCRERRRRDAGGGRSRDRGGAQARAEGAHRCRHQLRHGADAPRHRGRQARRARQGRGAGAPAVRLEYDPDQWNPVFGNLIRGGIRFGKALGLDARNHAQSNEIRPSENRPPAGPRALDRALLVGRGPGQLIDLAAILQIVGAVDHQVDDFAAGSSRGLRH